MESNSASSKDDIHPVGTNARICRIELTQRLSESFSKCLAETGEKELVLLSGPSGVGKTTLALSLRSRVEDAGGHLICGKFDQLSTTSETATSLYAPFIDAFTQYTNMVIHSGEETVTAVRKTLEGAMDSTELLAIRDMIPALDKILGDSHRGCSFTERSPVIRGPEAEKRFGYIFGLFVQAVSAHGMPILFVLDDLQWANPSALQLVANLVSEEKRTPSSRFMLLCTYRSDQISEDHPLSVMLRKAKDKCVRINDIKVNQLSKDEVRMFITRTFDLPSETTKELSDIVYLQTTGNVLFVVMFIEALQQGGNLLRSTCGQWQWKHNPVLVESIRSVSQIIVKKVEQLSDAAQEMIKTASCLGSTFSEAALGTMDIVAPAMLVPTLSAIQDTGLIVYDIDTRTACFAHDRIQLAVYKLIPDSVRAELHLEIGRRLWKTLPLDVRNENLLLIADQISRGVHLVDDPHEKVEIAEMFYWAGQKAAISSDFLTSSAFLNVGISLLHHRHWGLNYALSLRLHNFAAEIEYYNGNLRRVDELVDVVFKKARSFDDKLRMNFTRVYSLQSRNEMGLALDEGLILLKKLGERFPRRVNQLYILGALMRCKLMLLGKSDNKISSLPAMTDSRKLASMRLMLLTFLADFFVSDKFGPLLILRLVMSTLRYGMTDMACASFACLGLLLAQVGNVDEAFRVSQLALRVFREREAKEWQAWTYIMIYAGVYPLKHAYRELLDPIRDAHRVGLVEGDLHFSMVCAAVYSDLSFLAGRPLSKVLEDLSAFRALCIQYGQSFVLIWIEQDMQLCLNFMGQSKDPLILTGDVMNETALAEIVNEKSRKHLAWLLIVKLSLAVYFHNPAVAGDICRQLKNVNSSNVLRFYFATQLFFEGMAAAMLSRSSKTEMIRAKDIAGKLKVFAKRSPSNYLHKVHLIEAEIAASAGQCDEAMEKFNRAIELSRQERFINEQALACERAFHALQLFGRHEESWSYFHQAAALYQEWGAHAKVDHLTKVATEDRAGS